MNKIDRLIQTYIKKIQQLELSFVRGSVHLLDTQTKLIGLKGARGVGKTTLLMQYAKMQPNWEKEVLYVSLDHIHFSGLTLYDLAESFIQRGGKLLLLDEVHKYPNWSIEIKNIYDDFNNLKMVFTGSSLLHILNAKADLSRRAIVYHLQGLSFREYLHLEGVTKAPAITLTELLENHTSIAAELCTQFKPLAHFSDYLNSGYFPFYKESDQLYHHKLLETINLTLEIELPLLRHIEARYIIKLKQVLSIIAESVPFVPNMTKLAERMEISRNTLLNYIHFLDEAGLIHAIHKATQGVSKLQKPRKILLENPNFSHTLSSQIKLGTQRETFFVNQLRNDHNVNYPETGDFLIDKQYVFEVGGANKNERQIAGKTNAYLAKDNLEIGNSNHIPLWLFGFLY